MEISEEEAVQRFLAIKSVTDLAEILNVNYEKDLVYFLYRVPTQDRYVDFQIKKRNGLGTRQISAPTNSLKLIQRKLNSILQAVHQPKRSVHGFIRQRSILTNAEGHVRKKYVFNIDLENFFGSINFGRVRGMFMAKPYELPAQVATVLAQIVCHENSLPQGAPTSPIISNMICSRLDKNLQDFAMSHNCHYTRYADDITFSTNRNRFPSDLGYFEINSGVERIQIGDKLRNAIENNGFKINQSKTRLNTRAQRQDVTGLVVNQFANVDRRFIRNLRALLHAWNKYGLEKLQAAYLEKYNGKSRFPEKAVPSIVQVTYGRIQYLRGIRGPEDAIYRKLRDQFNELSPSKIHVPPDPWVERLKWACWVIEDEQEIIQGTAFFLKDIGIITNYHCVGPSPYIYHPSDPSKKYTVTISASHETIDLAVLKINEDIGNFHELYCEKYSSEIQYKRLM